MSCVECDRIRLYMAADPEMYRGEDMKCSAHKTVDNQFKQLRDLKRQLEIAVGALKDIKRLDGFGLDLSPPGSCHRLAARALERITKVTR